MPTPASVPGSETTYTPRREQMRAPVEASGKAGHSVSLTLWYPRMRESATNLEAASGFAWKPESLAQLRVDLKGSFLLKADQKGWVQKRE